MSDKIARLFELLATHSYKKGEFLLASGKTSEHYVDVRKTSLIAEGGALIGEILLDTIEGANWSPDAIGGMTLGADPLTTAVAIESFRRGESKASFLVRKEPKDHGTGQQIESSGDMKPGSRVVVLDDTVTTGGSTLKAVRAVEAAGHEVIGCACIVNREEGGKELLETHGFSLIEIFTLSELAAGLRG